ncbi:hypothetical protein CRG98_029105 [Punica granatum]|uniref:Uncharacterized protein n=1 Tax=Punica granatum TaxID=22663 RepID=A0A2I0J3J0_PUNGR|nr:hypothetical protein CRG98_029105 [Punica granatum]
MNNPLAHGKKQKAKRKREKQGRHHRQLGYRFAGVGMSRLRPTNLRDSVNSRRRTERVITPKALRWLQGDSNLGSSANLSAP